MEGLSDDQLITLLQFASAQSAYYLAAGSRCIQKLVGESSRIGVLTSQCHELQRQVDVLEKKSKTFDQQLRNAVSEKMLVEERLVEAETKLEKAKQANEGLSIQVESLERDNFDKEKALGDHSVKLKKVSADLDWLVKEGVVTIVDKVIDCPDFSQGFKRVKEVCWAAGEAAGRARARQEIAAGGTVDSSGGSGSGLAELMDDAIESFASLDYASLLKLGSLDIVGLRELCRVDEDDEVDSVLASGLVGVAGAVKKGDVGAAVGEDAGGKAGGAAEGENKDGSK